MLKRLVWALVPFTAVVAAQVPDHAPPFTADEIAIYRDFLLHYPEPMSNVIGMQDTTVAFVGTQAFGYEPNPPNVEPPAYSGRKLLDRIMALTAEDAVTARIRTSGHLAAAKDRGPGRGPDGAVRTHLTLSEIAFDSMHKRAAFVFSASCQCKGGSRGTVVYEQSDGHWVRKNPLLNFWTG